MDRSDEELVTSLDDDACASALVDRWWRPACSLARGLGLEPSEAEDAAQDALVKVVGARASFDRTRAFRPWFLRIVRNEALQRRRAGGRRRAREAHGARPERVDPVAPASDEVAVVRAALDDLPAEQREVVALHYLSGLTLAEVAQTVGVPRGTVDSRLGRGLARLRTRLGSRLEAVSALVPLLQGATADAGAGRPPALGALRAAARWAPTSLPVLAGAIVALVGVVGASSLLLAPEGAAPPGRTVGPSPSEGGAPAVATTATTTPAAVPRGTEADPVRAPAPATDPPPGAPVPVVVDPPSRESVLEVAFLGPDGLPVPGVRASFVLSQPEGSGAMGVGRRSGLRKDSPQTDAVGRVRLPVPADRDVNLLQLSWDAPEGLLDETSGRRLVTRDLRAEVVLEAGVFVEGRVVDDAGAPVSGASVYGDGVPQTRAGPDGRFRAGPLGAGRVLLGVRHGGRGASADVVAPARDVVVRLSSTTVQVRGRFLLLPDRTPAAGASLFLRRAGGSGEGCTLDAGGGFELEVGPGDYEAEVTGELGVTTPWTRPVRVPAGAARVDLGELLLGERGLRLRPVDAAGAPQPAMVQLIRRRSDEEPVVITAMFEGRVEIVEPPPGRCDLFVTPHDEALAMIRLQVDVPAAGDLELGDVLLAAAAGATVRVPGAKVRGLILVRDEERVWSPAGPADLVRTGRLPAGRWRAWAPVEGHAPVDLGTVDLEPGRMTALEGTLAEGGTVEVRLLDGAGAPRVGVDLALDLPFGPFWSGSRVQRTRGGGLAAWFLVPPGEWPLLLVEDQESGRGREVGRVRVEAGQPVRVDLRVP